MSSGFSQLFQLGNQDCLGVSVVAGIDQDDPVWSGHGEIGDRFLAKHIKVIEYLAWLNLSRAWLRQDVHSHNFLARLELKIQHRSPVCAGELFRFLNATVDIGRILRTRRWDLGRRLPYQRFNWVS